MTSDARARPREDEDDVQSATPPDEQAAEETAAADQPAEETADEKEPAEKDPAGEAAADEPESAEVGRKSRRRRRARSDDSGDDGGDDSGDGARTGGRPALPLVPLLAVLLVLLLAGAGYLWFTRPGTSAVRTDDYVDALQAARSGVVDMTSFDYLTLDDDIEQIRRVTTGDLRDEAVGQLDDRRQQITDSQATVSTSVVGAGVTRADTDDATVLLVLESTQKVAADPQAQVLRYRIQVDMKKTDGRWLLSGITGTGNDE